MVLKRKNSKYWQYRFMVNGKLYTGSTGTTDKEQAKKWERKHRQTLKGQKSVKGLVENFRDELAGLEPIALGKAFGEFLKAPKKEELSGHHLKVTTSFWNDFVAYVQGEQPTTRTLNNVSKEIAKGYISHLRHSGRYQKGISYKKGGNRRGTVQYTNKNKQLSPRTINGYHKACQYVWDILLGDSELANPFKGFDKLKMKNKTEHREPFTIDELDTIKKQAPPFVFEIFAIGLMTGLREGDICTLRWSEINLREDVVRRTMEKTGNTVEIPIMGHFKGFLESLPRTSEFVLPEQERLYRSNTNAISYRVKKFLESVDITTTKKVKDRTRAVTIKDVHSLRHNFCHFAAQHKVPLNVIQSIVGHMDADLTKMYADHFDRQQKKEHLEDIPDILGLAERANQETAEEEVEIVTQTQFNEDRTRAKLADLVQTLPIETIQKLLTLAEDKKALGS